MKLRQLIIPASLILGVACFGMANASERDNLKIMNIQTNYPLSKHAVNLPNNSTSLDINVEAKDADSVRFYYDSYEAGGGDSKQLIAEDTNPADGFHCTMNYPATEGFSRNIIIVASSKDGKVKQKKFAVYKEIEPNMSVDPNA